MMDCTGFIGLQTTDNPNVKHLWDYGTGIKYGSRAGVLTYMSSSLDRLSKPLICQPQILKAYHPLCHTSTIGDWNDKTDYRG